MHIIFGSAIEEIPNSFTILELDTFRMVKENRTDTAYCVVEKIPVFEADQLTTLKQLHHDMITYYKDRKWGPCADALQALKGAWGTELDSFYDIMLARVREYLSTDPGPNWTPVIEKQDS
jgi:hypothetical protein